MPKVIENLRENIIKCARRQLLERGYRELSIRGIAKECKIAVGTVYNYFASKEVLAAFVMLSDWLVELEDMRRGCEEAASVAGALTAIYGGITRFSGVYRSVWANYTFSDSAKSDYGDRHNLLVRQIADCLGPVVKKYHPDADEGTDIFLAENMLVCTGNSAMTLGTLLSIVRRILP